MRCISLFKKKRDELGSTFITEVVHLPYKRMYETRHTHASWALALGETPEWVARTLGHVDRSMVYRTYGRYIPNLAKLDGSAFESRFAEPSKNKRDTISYNLSRNRGFKRPSSGLTSWFCCLFDGVGGGGCTFSPKKIFPIYSNR